MIGNVRIFLRGHNMQIRANGGRWLLILLLLVLSFEVFLHMESFSELAAKATNSRLKASQDTIVLAPVVFPSESAGFVEVSGQVSEASPVVSSPLGDELSAETVEEGLSYETSEIDLFVPGDPRLDTVRYLFFISMGHQGTRGLYHMCNSTTRLCNFETRWNAPELNKFAMCKKSRLNAENIYEWSMGVMSDVYLPLLQTQMAEKQRERVMDPGHNLVCGRNYAALCELLGEEIGLVRWNRHPLQTAWSFCGEDSSLPGGGQHLSKIVAWILVMDEASYLRIPQDEYDSFNCFQAALWAQDELQQQYLDAANTTCHGRIIAEEQWQDSVDYAEAVERLTHVLPDTFDTSKESVDNGHASHDQYHERLSELREYHDQYLDIMRMYYPDLPDQLSNYVNEADVE